MRLRRHFYLIFAAALGASGAAVGAQAYVQSIKPFNGAIARICPVKQLEKLSAGDLNTIIQEYLDQLSAKRAKAMKQASQPMCVESIGGISCVNIAYIRAAKQLAAMDALARYACHSGYSCSGETSCTRARP